MIIKTGVNACSYTIGRLKAYLSILLYFRAVVRYPRLKLFLKAETNILRISSFSPLGVDFNRFIPVKLEHRKML